MNNLQHTSEILLAYLEVFDLRLSGHVTLYDTAGVEWIGVGGITEVDSIRSDVDGGDYTFSVALNGGFLSEDERAKIAGTQILLYTGHLNGNNRIASKTLHVSAIMNEPVITNGEISRIEIECYTGIKWDGVSPRRVNDQWQRVDYPDDEGCVRLAANGSQEITW